MKFSGILLGIIAVLAIFVISVYNKFPTLDENVSEKWSQVQNQYKRRADLIPNLVSTVKGYAAHEKEVFTQVTEARSKVSSINIDANSLDDAKKLGEFMQAQNELGSALSRLIAVSEAYPDLKANQNFLSLQSQLEGTENRIAVARKDFISAVKEYNIALRTFPSNIVAKIFHPSLKIKANFEASEAENQVPAVNFN
ncbi:MAG: LemA family protein [Campylobacter sp.]|nr:LemA family protein [Campylobacter sp.]